MPDPIETVVTPSLLDEVMQKLTLKNFGQRAATGAILGGALGAAAGQGDPEQGGDSFVQAAGKGAVRGGLLVGGSSVGADLGKRIGAELGPKWGPLIGYLLGGTIGGVGGLSAGEAVLGPIRATKEASVKDLATELAEICLSKQGSSTFLNNLAGSGVHHAVIGGLLEAGAGAAKDAVTEDGLSGEDHLHRLLRRILKGGAGGFTTVPGLIGGGLTGEVLGSNTWTFPMIGAIGANRLGAAGGDKLADMIGLAPLGTKQAFTPVDTPVDLRDQFEAMLARDEAIRSQQERLKSRVQDLASQEDTSLGGYLGTGLERTLVPVPHTGLEAVTRGLGAGAGGLLGWRQGRRFEKLDPATLKQVFAPLGGGGAELTPAKPGLDTAPLQEKLRGLAGPAADASIGKAEQLAELAKARQTNDIYEVTRLEKALGGGKKGPKAPEFGPEVVQKAMKDVEGLGKVGPALKIDTPLGKQLQKIVGSGKEKELAEMLNLAGGMTGKELQHATRDRSIRGLMGIDTVGRLGKALGLEVDPVNADKVNKFKSLLGTLMPEHGAVKLRGEIANVAEQQSDMISRLLPKLRGRRILGGTVGALGGAAVTGLPFAANALLTKSEGGEQASRARKKLEQTVKERELLHGKREEILARLKDMMAQGQPTA